MRTTTSILLALALCLPLAAGAEVSKEQLLEMADAGMDPGLMASVIERDCVDFEVDPETLIELTPRVPAAVLEAAVDCRGLARRSETLECRIYRRITADPDLADFPAVVRSITRERVVLHALGASTWIQSKSRKSADRARLAADEERKRARLIEVVEGFPTVPEAKLLRQRTYTSILGLKAAQSAAMTGACSIDGGFLIDSDPPGATVYVNGAKKGETPLQVELLSGEYRLLLRKRNYLPHEGQYILREAETRRVTVRLERLALLAISSTPAGAVVLVDGEYEGTTPAEVYVAGGEHEVRVIHPRHRPSSAVLGVEPGETVALDSQLESVPGDEYCYDLGLSGNVAASLELLAERLLAAEMRLVVPLYGVLTDLEHRQQATHVVDGDQILFEPGLGDHYVDHPLEMMGEELQGWYWAQTATGLISVPAGPATVTGLEKPRKSTLELKLRHGSGEKGALFFDFTRELDQVSVGELADAFCTVFSKHPAFAGL